MTGPNRTKTLPRNIDRPAYKRRKEVEKILLEARRLAERGWIKKGRESTRHMLMDCIERAYSEHTGRTMDFGYFPLTGPVLGLVLAYVCRCTYQGNDPGNNHGRYKQLYKTQGTVGMAVHGGTFDALRKAVELVRRDLKELRHAERG